MAGWSPNRLWTWQLQWAITGGRAQVWVCAPVFPSSQGCECGRDGDSPFSEACSCYLLWSVLCCCRGSWFCSTEPPLAPVLYHISLKHCLSPRLHWLLHFVRDHFLREVLERRECTPGVIEARNCGKEQDFQKQKQKTGLCWEPELPSKAFEVSMPVKVFKQLLFFLEKSCLVKPLQYIFWVTRNVLSSAMEMPGVKTGGAHRAEYIPPD